MAGNPQEGEKRVKEVGCLGCHSLAGTPANDFGPELSGLGSKVTPEWLYTWLKDPKHYSKEARMPNLRLSDQEVADITSYLISQRNNNFENQTLPEVKPQALDEMVLGYLQKNMTRAEAEKELNQMNRQSKQVFLGKKIIGRQGCFACHAIKGFENAKPIGTELTAEGSKDLHQFDFGHVELEHARHAWIYQKLKEPRIFDKGKLIREYDDKLRMPDFGFTHQEAEALTTFVLSLTKDPIPLEMQRRLNLKEQQIEKGRFIVSKYNCNGCHTIDGKPGKLWAIATDKGSAPPILDGEGAKVQEKWLHDFLRQPRTIRPWLSYRMPTFGLSEEEITQIVQYFTYLSGQEVSYQGLQLPPATPEKLEAGETLFTKFQCAKCHSATSSLDEQVEPASTKMGASFLAPDLRFAKERLKPEWVTQWLEDPQVLQPGTMMPGFFPDGQTPMTDLLGGDAKQQIEAIRDYLYRYEPKEKEPKP
jgi:mono/diheme cytochrome c family protein